MDQNSTLTPTPGLNPTPAPTAPSTTIPSAPAAAPAPAAPTPTISAPAAPTPTTSAPVTPTTYTIAAPNPAAMIANAALAGATPVVTTTDDFSAPTEPSMQSILDPALADQLLAATEEENVGPVSLTPSADFQSSLTATVSAQPNPGNNSSAGLGLDMMQSNPYGGANPSAPQFGASEIANSTTNQDLQSTDFSDSSLANHSAHGEQGKEKIETELLDEPLVAAAPVPGSIGSAKSYADIQRAEVEKTAKMATANSGKRQLTKRTLIIGAVASVVLVGSIVMFIMLFGGQKATPTKPSVAQPTVSEPDLSTLSCRRNLAPEEYSSFGAISGTQENIFYFKGEILDGLATNFAYTYSNQTAANSAELIFKRDFGDAKPVEKVYEEKNAQADNTPKTAAEMLKHYVSTKNLTITHGMEILSADIDAWLASDNYSDKTYGATEDAKADLNQGSATRNLAFYNRLQNNIGYACSINKGY